MDLGAQFLEALLVLDAEMLLLVDNDETEILEAHPFAEHRMGADDDIELSRGGAKLGGFKTGGANHPRHVRDLDRQMCEARGEILVMLTREKRRRHDHRHLLAFDRSSEGRAQGNLGLAETDVAADEAVHRPAGSHVVQNCVDRGLLVVGFLIGKAGAKFGILIFWRDELRSRLGLPRGGDLDQTRRHVENALAHARLALLPSNATQSVEFDFCLLRAIARQKLEIFDGQKQLGALGIMQLEAIMRRAGGLDRLQTGETRDPMIDMDNDVACGERPRFGQKILGTARLAAAAGQPVAQDILFADKREIGRLETLLDANDRQGQCGWAKARGLAQARTPAPCS